MTRRTPTGQRLTELILETFRLNGALLSRGDRLVQDIGLTSARQRRPQSLARAPRTRSRAKLSD